MIFDFLEVPGVPGAPPEGSLGGGPGSKFAGRFMPGPLGFGIVFYIDFDVDF